MCDERAAAERLVSSQNKYADDVPHGAGRAGDLDPEYFRGFELCGELFSCFSGDDARLSYDHASGWTEYSFALPLSKELQVAEKYLVGLLCTAVSAALNGIFCGIRFWMGKPLPAMPIGLLLGAGAASILLINGIMLPLYYRFGAEKARMLYMLMFAGMGAALGGGMVLMDAVPEPGAAIAIVGVLATVLALYAVSWRVSVAWYGKYKK